MTYEEFNIFINKECNFNKSMLRAINFQNNYIKDNKIPTYKLKNKSRILLNDSFNLLYVENNNLILDLYCYNKEEYIESIYPINILIDDKYEQTIINLINLSIEKYEFEKRKDSLKFQDVRRRKTLRRTVLI